MQRFVEKLNIFQLNKVLIVLCHCGSVWQKGVYDTLKVPSPQPLNGIWRTRNGGRITLFENVFVLICLF